MEKENAKRFLMLVEQLRKRILIPKNHRNLRNILNITGLVTKYNFNKKFIDYRI